MKTLNRVLVDFFGGFPQVSSGNTKRMLGLMTNVPEHKNRIESILSLTGNADISVSELGKMLKLDLAQYNDDTEVELLIKKPLAGNRLKLIKRYTGYTTLWSMHGLYWAYHFHEKTDEEILSNYNHRIGDIALKYIELYHKMKQKEELTGDNKHPFSFYEFIAVGKVRAIEFLIGASCAK